MVMVHAVKAMMFDERTKPNVLMDQWMSAAGREVKSKNVKKTRSKPSIFPFVSSVPSLQ